MTPLTAALTVSTAPVKLCGVYGYNAGSACFLWINEGTPLGGLLFCPAIAPGYFSFEFPEGLDLDNLTITPASSAMGVGLVSGTVSVVALLGH